MAAESGRKSHVARPQSRRGRETVREEDAGAEAAEPAREGGRELPTGGAETPPRARWPRTLRLAGVLALLFGFLGFFAGISGAATFIPYRTQNQFTMEIAQAVTAVAAAGAVLSLLGFVSGWWLLRGKARAWRTSLGAAAGCVAAVAAFAAIVPPTAPSPAPGGVGATGFLAVVAAAYGLEALLLFLGRGAVRARTVAG